MVGVSRPSEMSPEAWRRTGSDWRRGILRDRRGTFSASGSICMGGVALSATQARFVWQALHYSHIQMLLWFPLAISHKSTFPIGAAALCTEPGSIHSGAVGFANSFFLFVTLLREIDVTLRLHVADYLPTACQVRPNPPHSCPHRVLEVLHDP